MPAKKKSTQVIHKSSIRYTDEEKRLLLACVQAKGVSQTDVVRMGIRAIAKEWGIVL